MFEIFPGMVEMTLQKLVCHDVSLILNQNKMCNLSHVVVYSRCKSKHVVCVNILYACTTCTIFGDSVCSSYYSGNQSGSN